MQETDSPVEDSSPFSSKETDLLGLGWLGKLSYSVSAKLMASLFVAMTVIFLVFGFFSVRLHRKHLEAAALVSAGQQGGVWRRSACRERLRNDRGGIYEVMISIA